MPKLQGGAGCSACRGAPDVRRSTGCPAAIELIGACCPLVFLCLVLPDIPASAKSPVAVASWRLHLMYFLICIHGEPPFL